MKPENDKLLCEKYPKIFAKRFSHVTESNMAFGFECGDGWFDIIDTLCQSIQNHIDHKVKYESLTEEQIYSLQVVAAQVKEKFGGLRFYVDGGDEYIDGLIGLAEGLSYRICETCGDKGRTYNHGWVRTHCEPCEQEYLEKRKSLTNK